MLRKLLIIHIFSTLYIACYGQSKPLNPETKAYIAKFNAIAVAEMQQYKIPASITLAQGIIESNNGKSPLALDANNHFGIKCQKDWTGDTYLFDDDEENECFRKYKNAEDSYRDHSVFLTTRQRYAELFSLSITDYKGWARGLSQFGYATNPNYPDILIRVIEDYQLYLYDNISEQQQIANNEIKVQPEIAGNNSGEVSEKGPVVFRKAYRMPQPSEFKLIYTSKLGRKVYQNNGIPFVFARKNDTWYDLASEFGIYTFQIYRQNDLQLTDPITEGQIIYLEPKKRQALVKSYIFDRNDSMYAVSQRFGIKLSHLYKYNGLLPGDEPAPGTTILLRK